jgi:mevalonate kinase
MALITENRAHLVALGVSHPVLEAIREETAAERYCLNAKVTGAGGGGALSPSPQMVGIIR